MILPVLGLLIMLVPTIFFFKSITAPPLAQLSAPGVKQFQIDEPGNYTVWRSYAGVIDDTEFRSEAPELPVGLNVSILDIDNNTSVPLNSSLGTSVSNGDSHKKSLFTADLTLGHYKLIASSTSKPVQLAITKDKGLKGFIVLFVCYAVGFIVTLIGVIYAIITMINVLRRRPVPTISDLNQ